MLPENHNYTTAANTSTQDVPSLKEMHVLVQKEVAKSKVLESSAVFAAMGIVCHECKKRMKYDEDVSTFQVCCHVMDQIRKEIPEVKQGPPALSLTGVRFVVVSPSELSDI